MGYTLGKGMMMGFGMLLVMLAVIVLGGALYLLLVRAWLRDLRGPTPLIR